MARNRLTTTQCNARRKAGKLADGDGLYLQTSPNGNKSFVFVFIRSGRRREMGLGPFGTGTGQVSLAAARDKADEVRAILGRGGDPFTIYPPAAQPAGRSALSPPSGLRAWRRAGATRSTGTNGA